ncbi:hypothetical protein LO772_12415 [Yinghuangia sp. ASG 101]|uniref:hypothetical protein n=1 Tax=Yinghuangia sp. ASG 101 TaxID=2896848 RepID=UPI001E2ED044|nr:hypothetical protein [Yinghuangia sp. ASG 101]UGQ14316.1 hypothetical protein LO772_12415 [Yinghuangia sp. ASG 101]
MDVTAYIALLDELDAEDAAVADRLGAELPEQVRRLGDTATRRARARDAVRTPRPTPPHRAKRLSGVQVACLVEGAGPAVDVLRTLRRVAPRQAWAYLDGTRGLAATIRTRLGADPAAWTRLQRRLASYPGLLAELVEESGRAAEDNDETAASPTASVPAVPRELRRDMRQLLMLLDAETLAALVPRLHRGTVVDLARFGAPLGPETLAWIAATATPRQRLLLAKARWSRPGLAAALAALDDSEVNAALYLNVHTSVAVRARIMAAADRVPLHPSVIERVRSTNARALRLPALWSGDPLLVRAALLRREQTTASVGECLRAWEEGGHEALMGLCRPDAVTPLRLPRYRSLLLVAVAGIWRRHGMREAARLVDEMSVAPKDRTFLGALFAADDGQERLAAEIAAKSGTRTLVKRLRRHYPTRLWPLIECPWVDWEQIARLDARVPLSGTAWAHLAAGPGCPERGLPAEADQDTDGPVGAGRWPTMREVSVPREWVGGQWVFATPARRGAAMPPEHLFTAVTPAAQAFNTYGNLAEFVAAGSAELRYESHLRELVDGHLGTSTDARVVAMRLMGDFPGTVRELFETAAAMTLVTAAEPGA